MYTLFALYSSSYLPPAKDRTCSSLLFSDFRRKTINNENRNMVFLLL
jgi:hypothetical protein